MGTVWGGSLRFKTPMCFASAFVSMFVIGGLSGIYMAATPVDLFIHNTYFIVAHIHYVLFGGSLFGVFAGIYFWFPKMFGRMMNEFWVINFFYSIFRGPKAPRNPWNSTTLEWTLPSPPGYGNFETTPTIYRGPYEYSVPGMEQDFLPQNQPEPEPALIAAH
jgi:heme/copper-type cytochrome/quinol oxidase subunit 1